MTPVDEGNRVSTISGKSNAYVPAQQELSDEEIDSRFAELLSRSREAFVTDPSYLVDMAEHAALIAYKRSLWAVRREVEQAEKAAVSACSSANLAATCENKSACGFGARCIFASDENRRIEVGAGDEKKRPMPATSGYSTEAAIAEILKVRAIVPPNRSKKRR